jgi:hypothetical protein
VDPVADILARLERGELGNTEAVLAYLAGGAVDLPDSELNEARRRAVLLVAAGGDLHRELDVDDRAVKSLATDLWSDERREQLAGGLDALALQARDLPRVRETVINLARDLDLAWRIYTLAILAEELGDED